MDRLEAIVIPSGNFKQDLERARVATIYGSKLASDTRYFPKPHYIVSGIGPDTEKALKASENNANFKGLNFHLELYDYMKVNIKGIFGIDVNSLNSRENLAYTFPKGTTGTYGIVSYPLHLLRIYLTEKRLKSRNLMSKDVRLKYIPTKSFFKQSFKEFLYEGLAIFKELFSSYKPLNKKVSDFFK